MALRPGPDRPAGRDPAERLALGLPGARRRLPGLCRLPLEPGPLQRAGAGGHRAGRLPRPGPGTARHGPLPVPRRRRRPEHPGSHRRLPADPRPHARALVGRSGARHVRARRLLLPRQPVPGCPPPGRRDRPRRLGRAPRGGGGRGSRRPAAGHRPCAAEPGPGAGGHHRRPRRVGLRLRRAQLPPEQLPALPDHRVRGRAVEPGQARTQGAAPRRRTPDPDRDGRQVPRWLRGGGRQRRRWNAGRPGGVGPAAVGPAGVGVGPQEAR